MRRAISVRAVSNSGCINLQRLAYQPIVSILLLVGTGVLLVGLQEKPLGWAAFGLGMVSLLLGLPGLAITLYLGIYRLLGLGSIAQRPLLLLGVLLMVLGIQLLSIGLIGEMIVFTHAREIREYRIEEIIRGSVEKSPAKEKTGT